MCNKISTYLRISNTGSAVDTLVANQKFCVNLPANLRSRGACYITVIEGSVVITTAVGVSYIKDEIGVLSNIPILGFNTETPAGSNNFMSENNKVLFTVNQDSLTGHDGTDNKVINQMLNQRTFYCGGLPERIEFERYLISGGTIQPFIIDNYLSFTLQIEFIDEQ